MGAGYAWVFCRGGSHARPNDLRRLLPTGQRGLDLDSDLRPGVGGERTRGHADRAGLWLAERARPGRALRGPAPALPLPPLDPEDRILRPGRIMALLTAGDAGLARRGFDLLHIQTPFVAHYTGLALARRLGVPVVESYHTFFEQYLSSYIPLIPPAWLRMAARRFSASQGNAVDALVAPSQAMREVLEGYGVRTHIRVIPTGIEPGRLPPGDGARFRRAHGIALDRPVLVHVGRIAFEKNIGFLLQVLARLVPEIPDLLLVVAGEGPARAALETQCARLGLADHIRFIGYLERGQSLADCYCAGDAFVFASRTETQGLVLLEAMALGVPVVSTAVMGTREVLAQGRGCLIAGRTKGTSPPGSRFCSSTPGCADSSAPTPRPTPGNGPPQPWSNGCWTSTGRPCPDPEAGTESAKP